MLLFLDQITHPFENGDQEVLYSFKESDFSRKFELLRFAGIGVKADPFTGSKYDRIIKLGYSKRSHKSLLSLALIIIINFASFYICRRIEL